MEASEAGLPEEVFGMVSEAEPLLQGLIMHCIVFDQLLILAARGVSKSITVANGLKVNGFAGHAVNRAIGSAGRAVVKPSAMLDALKNPLKIKNVVIDQLGRQSQRFIGQFGEVVINPQTGRIISVNPTSSSKAARLLRQLGR